MVKRQDASTGKIIEDNKQPEEKPADSVGKQVLHIKVYSPYKMYFDEEANSITAVNRTGEFDVLPKHHNFISLLDPCELAIDSLRGPVPIKISGGIMHVRGDNVVVFLDV